MEQAQGPIGGKTVLVPATLQRNPHSVPAKAPDRSP